jgi:hypothetical protein
MQAVCARACTHGGRSAVGAYRATQLFSFLPSHQLKLGELHPGPEAGERRRDGRSRRPSRATSPTCRADIAPSRAGRRCSQRDEAGPRSIASWPLSRKDATALGGRSHRSLTGPWASGALSRDFSGVQTHGLEQPEQERTSRDSHRHRRRRVVAVVLAAALRVVRVRRGPRYSELPIATSGRSS